MTTGRTTVFVARRFHTMEPGFPTAEAVAVREGRILAVGSLATVTSALGDEPFEVDETRTSTRCSARRRWPWT